MREKCRIAERREQVMSAGSGFFHRVKELAKQFFSVIHKGSESSKEQRIGIRHHHHH